MMTTQELKVRHMLKQYLKEFRFAVLGSKVYLWLNNKDVNQVKKIEATLQKYFNLNLKFFHSHFVWRYIVHMEAGWLAFEQHISYKDYRRIAAYSRK
jgi:hypothetical protein